MSSVEKSTALKDLFPKKNIYLSGVLVTTVTPLPMKAIGDVLDILEPLFSSETEQLTVGKLFAYIKKDAIKLIPLCTNTDIAELPFAVIPDIIDALIEQNFPKDSLKKWMSLIIKVKLLGSTIKGYKKQ